MAVMYKQEHEFLVEKSMIITLLHVTPKNRLLR